MPYFLSPFGNAQAFDSNGNPLVGGSWRTFLAGTSTAETTYTSQTGAVPQGTTITLDAMGLPANGPVWMLGGRALKFRLFNAASVLLDEWDNISGIGDVNTAPDEWVLFGASPTYLTATTFTVAGDQTNIFQVNRKLKSTNTGGTVYSSVVSAVFSASATTVTVANLLGVLDAGLLAVSYGLLAADNQSIPPVDEPVNGQTGTAYTYAKSDKGKLVTHSNAAAIAGTLPIASTFGKSWWMDVQNRGAGALTLTPTTSTIDGAASLVITAGQGVRIVSDGANYFTQRGAGGSAATAAELKTGTDSAKFATAAALLAAQGFTAYFESAQQTITAGGALTIAHGLTRKPVHFSVVLVCTTAELNYTAGMEVSVPVWYGSGISFHGFSLVPDTTNLNIRFVNAASVYVIGDKTTGAGTTITLANWKVVVRAWA